MMKLSEKCHPSKKIVIHTERKHNILTHSLQLSFLHWVKVILSGIRWATAHYKVIQWLLSLACGLPSVIITSVRTSLASPELTISVSSSVSVVNSVRQLHRYLMGCAGNSHSVETDPGSRKHNIRLSNKKYFCIRIALNWNNHIICSHHGAENDFRIRSEKLWQLPWDHVCLPSRGTLFNTLAINTSILSTYSLFWNNYVNLQIFSSDNIKCKLPVLLLPIHDRRCVSTRDVR